MKHMDVTLTSIDQAFDELAKLGGRCDEFAIVADSISSLEALGICKGGDPNPSDRLRGVPVVISPQLSPGTVRLIRRPSFYQSRSWLRQGVTTKTGFNFYDQR